MLHLDGVAHGVDVRVARSQVLIHLDRTAEPQFEPCFASERALGCHADRHDREVGVERSAFGECGAYAPVQSGKAGHVRI